VEAPDGLSDVAVAEKWVQLKNTISYIMELYNGESQDKDITKQEQ